LKVVFRVRDYTGHKTILVDPEMVAEKAQEFRQSGYLVVPYANGQKCQLHDAQEVEVIPLAAGG